MASYPPCGFDRADGTAGMGGTGNGGAVVFRPSSVWLEEDIHSPEIERAEQCTSRHIYNCDPTTAQALVMALGRGTLRQDSSGNYWRVLSCACGREKADNCKVVLVEEGIGFDTPPDQCSFDIVELNPPLEEHPRWSQDTFGIGTKFTTFNLDSDGNVVNSALTNGATALAYCKQAANSGAILTANESESQLTNSANFGTGTTATILSFLAKNLIAKYKKHITTFYLPGLRVSWSQHFWLPQPFNPGGQIQDPVTTGGLPAFFWSDDGTPTGNNVLEKILNLVNPTLYPVASTSGKYLSWLRQADQTNFERSLIKVTRTWIGGPLGKWDADLYYTS